MRKAWCFVDKISLLWFQAQGRGSDASHSVEERGRETWAGKSCRKTPAVLFECVFHPSRTTFRSHTRLSGRLCFLFFLYFVALLLLLILSVIHHEVTSDTILPLCRSISFVLTIIAGSKEWQNIFKLCGGGPIHHRLIHNLLQRCVTSG